MNISRAKRRDQWLKERQGDKTSRTISERIDSALPIDRKHPWRLSEILAALLSCQQELVLDNLRRRRALGHEGNLKLTFASERPPPSQAQPQLAMAAEERTEYL